MSRNFYDYDADTDVQYAIKEEIKNKRKKTIINRTVVILAAVAIIAIIATVTVFTFSLISGNNESESTFDEPPNSSVPSGSDASAGSSDSSETSDNSEPSESSDASEPSDTSSPSEQPESEATSGSEEPSDEPSTPVSDPSPSTPSIIANGYTVSDKADPAYFDDVVFVGDSVSYGLELYVTSERSSGRACLGNAQFLTSGSLSYANLLWDVSSNSVHPTYNGKKMKLEESLPMINPKKIYILLGSNDVGLYGVDGSVEHAKTMLGNIQRACPNAVIIVLSTTPKLKAAEERNGALNNADIDAFNAKMKVNCPEWGYIWMDFSSQFKLPDGTLNPEYCGDADSMGIHFLGSAYKLWVDFFEKHKIYPAS